MFVNLTVLVFLMVLDFVIGHKTTFIFECVTNFIYSPIQYLCYFLLNRYGTYYMVSKGILKVF